MPGDRGPKDEALSTDIGKQQSRMACEGRDHEDESRADAGRQRAGHREEQRRKDEAKRHRGTAMMA
jgi:hypothetical protein